MSGTMVGVPTGPVDTILAAPSLRRRANRHQGVGLWRNWYSTPKKSTPMAADDALPLRPTNLQPRGALPRTNGRGGGETHHGAGQGCVRGPPLHNKQGQQEITTEAMTTTTTRIKKRRTTTGHDGMDAIPPSNHTRGIIMPPLTGHTRTVRVNGAGCNDKRPTIGPEQTTTHKIDGRMQCHIGATWVPLEAAIVPTTRIGIFPCHNQHNSGDNTPTNSLVISLLPPFFGSGYYLAPDDDFWPHGGNN